MCSPTPSHRPVHRVLWRTELRGHDNHHSFRATFALATGIHQVGETAGRRVIQCFLQRYWLCFRVLDRRPWFLPTCSSRIRTILVVICCVNGHPVDAELRETARAKALGSQHPNGRCSERSVMWSCRRQLSHAKSEASWKADTFDEVNEPRIVADPRHHIHK